MRNKSFAKLALVASLAATSAFGQQLFGQQILKADIPFEFRVGSTVMPAGQYEVNLSFGNIPGMLSLRCYECRATALAKTINADAGQARTEATLVFTSYGDTYFLSAVWSPDRREGNALPKDKSEREIARSASLVARTSEVLLARR
jgi:hypothetical protein